MCFIIVFCNTFVSISLLICLHQFWTCLPIVSDYTVHFMSGYLPNCLALRETITEMLSLKNEMRVKSWLTFFSLNLNDNLKSNGKQGAGNQLFSNAQRFLLSEDDVFECAYYIIYVNRFRSKSLLGTFAFSIMNFAAATSFSIFLFFH